MTKPFVMSEFNPSPRILLGPGPGSVHYRVYQAMSSPVIGYLDPQLLASMDEISVMLRDLFQTRNRLTIALPGTGSAGMEASFVNFVEPGDTVVLSVKGYFGERMGIPYLYQIHMEGKDDILDRGVRVMPAGRFLAALP